MKILVLGGSGLVGSGIIEKIQGKFDLLTTYNKKEIISDIVSIKIHLPLDLSILKKFMEKEKPDVTINAIAYSNPDYCEDHQEEVFSLHVEMTEKIFEICSRINSKLIFISTDYVFDGKTGNYSEQDKTNPINYYGHTKDLAEKIVLKNPKNTVLRTALVYGHGNQVRFLKYVVDNLKSGKEVLAYNDIFSSATLLDEFVEAVEKVIKNNVSGIFHLSGSSCVSRYDFAKIIARKFSLDETLIKPISIKNANIKAKRPIKSCLDNTKCRNILGVNFSDINTGVSKVFNNTKNS